MCLVSIIVVCCVASSAFVVSAFLAQVTAEDITDPLEAEAPSAPLAGVAGQSQIWEDHSTVDALLSGFNVEETLSESGDTVSLAHGCCRMLLGLRFLTMAATAFLSGMSIAAMPPLQSALLCGI